MATFQGNKVQMTGRLSVANSILLDVIRFGAAVLVFWSHATQPRFSTGFGSQVAAGHLAVCVFFVLSGFVIRMVTQQRRADWRTYLVERASRIYSVVLPCLFITLILEASALAVDADRYHSIAAGFDWSRLAEVPGQFLAILTFTSQLWGYAVTPLSNIVFWSIPFECFYYALYGIALYAVRGKWIWTVCLLVIAGPAIAMFYPIWLLGCVVHDVHRRLQSRSRWRALGLSSLGVLGLAGVLMVLRPQIMQIIRATGETRRVAWITDYVLQHIPHSSVLLRDGSIPWLGWASPSFFLVGVVTAALLLWSLLLIDWCVPDVPRRVGAMVRTVADSTFTLYLVHEPMLILVSTWVGHPLKSRQATLGVVIGIIVACIPLSLLFDRFKFQLRGWLSSALRWIWPVGRVRNAGTVSGS